MRFTYKKMPYFLKFFFLGAPVDKCYICKQKKKTNIFLFRQKLADDKLQCLNQQLINFAPVVALTQIVTVSFHAKQIVLQILYKNCTKVVQKYFIFVSKTASQSSNSFVLDEFRQKIAYFFFQIIIQYDKPLLLGSSRIFWLLIFRKTEVRCLYGWTENYTVDKDRQAQRGLGYEIRSK